MADLEKKADKLMADINQTLAGLEERRGAIKVDSNELARHPKIVAQLGEYAEVCPLKSGDYAFNTAWSRVARVEVKTWDNLIDDVGNKHITDQLRKQVDTGISILLIQGFATATIAGMIKTHAKEYHRPWWWLWNYLTSAQLAGTYIYFSPIEALTPKIIIALYEYCAKAEHTVMGERQKLVSMHPTLTPHQRTYTAIPGVGDELAKQFDKKFGSLKDLCNATPEEIADVAGKAKGRNIYNYVRNLI